MTTRIDEPEFRRVAKIVMAPAARCLHKFGCLHEEIEDAMQTVLLQITKHWNRLDREDTDGMVSFACVVAINVARDHRREWKKRARLFYGHGDDVECFILEGDGDGGVFGAASREGEQRRVALETVDAILETMPCEPREVFILYEINGYTAREIADAIGIPEGTVASRLRIARAQFEARVKQRSWRTAPRPPSKGAHL